MRFHIKILQCYNDDFQYIIKNKKSVQLLSITWNLFNYFNTFLNFKSFPGIVGISHHGQSHSGTQMTRATQSWEYETSALWHEGSEHLIEYISKSSSRTVTFHYDMITNTPINMDRDRSKQKLILRTICSQSKKEAKWRIYYALTNLIVPPVL